MAGCSSRTWRDGMAVGIASPPRCLAAAYVRPVCLLAIVCARGEVRDGRGRTACASSSRGDRTATAWGFGCERCCGEWWACSTTSSCTQRACRAGAVEGGWTSKMRARVVVMEGLRRRVVQQERGGWAVGNSESKLLSQGHEWALRAFPCLDEFRT
jgi:hypothetical protein